MSDFSNIHVLPSDLQNQIAAGEVVERPSSVIKELIENSLDAKATEVHIEIDGGGQNRILVQDNGQGLEPDDLPKALTRHATSKIARIEDLNQLSSFGFRGEALPSIASVSRLTMGSIVPNQTEGFQVSLEFGKIVDQGPVPLRQGTYVTVRDLFRNTPARLKFLKKTATESKRCLDIVYKMGLAHLDCAFTLISNEKNTVSFPKDQSLEERLQHMWPGQITDKLRPVSSSNKDFHLSGVIGSPETAQGRADRIFFYVNTRPVQDKLLLAALRQAYSGSLLSREYPQAVLLLDIPPREADINVHPAKAEIRFRNEKDIFSFVHQGVKATLSSYQSSLSPLPAHEHFQSGNTERQNPRHTFQTFENISQPYLKETRAKSYSTPDNPSPLSETKGDNLQKEKISIQSSSKISSDSQNNISGLVYLGQVSYCYLLLKDQRQDLLLLDQHAAHERILYHLFKTTGEDGSQQLLALPMELYLHPAEQYRLEQITTFLRRLGFSFDFDQKSLMSVKAIPSALTWQQAKDFLKAALAEQISSMDDLWTLMACRQAIKAGQSLARDEALNLIETWIKTPERDYCPHGRPVSIRMTTSDLEKMFKRQS